MREQLDLPSKTKKVLPAGTPTQTTGGKYQTFNNLNNLKKKSDYAQTSLIDGKKGAHNRPSTVTVSDFRCNLPVGAIVTKVTVRYKHSKVAYNNKHCNIPAPTITLMANVTNNNHMKYSDGSFVSKKGQAPTATSKEEVVTFNRVWNYDEFNTSNFGVRINYPANTSTEKGYVRLDYIEVTLTYREAKYPLSASLLEGQYNGDEFTFILDCGNSNNVTHNPTVTVTVPVGLNFKRIEGGGTFVQVDGTNYLWTPALGYNRGNSVAKVTFDSNFTFGTTVESLSKSIVATENVKGSSKTVNFTILRTRPVDPMDTGGTGSGEQTIITGGDSYNTRIIAEQGEEVTVNLVVEPFHGLMGDYEWGYTTAERTLIDNSGMEVYWNDTYGWKPPSKSSYAIVGSIQDGLITMKIRSSVVGTYKLPIYQLVEVPNPDGQGFEFEYRIAGYLYFDIIPTGLTNPSLTILELTEEEQNRLGDGYNYMAQSYLKLNTSETYARNWGKNHRIGVFNNHIEDNMIDLFDTATFSQSVATFHVNTDVTNALEDFDSIRATTEDDTATITISGNNIYISFSREIAIEGLIELLDENENVLVSSGVYMDFDLQTVHVYNNKFDTTDYTDLSKDDILDNAEYWSEALLEKGSFENLECKFTYNKDYPLYILITGDYPEATVTTTCDFTEPCIVEDDYYNGQQSNGNYPVPILDLIANDGSTSEINISPQSRTDTIIAYDLPLHENFGTDQDIAIRGLQVNTTFENNTDNLTVYASLVSDKNTPKTRSTLLDENLNDNNIITLGQPGDLWGFSTLDIENLEDWEIHLSLNNTLNDYTGVANYGNINLDIYYELVDHQNIQCKIEGEDLSYYGVFLTDVKVPEGLKTDTDYIEVNGTDTNAPFRQAIRAKTIEVEFEVGDNCSLEEATMSLRELTRLLVNKRDKYNRPIPKRIEFSHYPDVYWEYVIEDTFDNDIEISSYSVKAKLVVYNGTAYDKAPTVTAASGYVSGIANIRPVLYIYPSSTLVTIRETESDQEFNIGYSGDYTGKIIEINCEDRVAYLKDNEDDDTPLDISYAVDFNSDWFILQGEYNFEITGGAILQVNYQERW